MDTKQLVVGQDVYIVNNDGTRFCQGNVAKVMPEGVEVLTAPHVMRIDGLSQRNYDVDTLSWVVPLRFDNEGKGYDGNKRCTDVFWGEQDILWWGHDVYGLGPWHIDDVPFAERKTLPEQAGITKQKKVTVEKSPFALTTNNRPPNTGRR